MEKPFFDSGAIDFTSGGIFAGSLGHSNKRVLDALAGADCCCCYSAHYRHPAVERYIDMLKEFTGFEAVALFSTGAEATEAFWRVARVYTGKPGIWGGLSDPDLVGTDAAPPDSMHGVTLGSLIMAGKMQWETIGMLPRLENGTWSAAPEMTGGMIMEPYHAPSAQWHREDPTMQRVRARVKEFPDMLFCVDEVQGGFGRTGKLWAHEWYPGLKPDFVCAGKGMGGGFPLSALLGPRDILESKVVIDHAHLHSTHSGHPVMAAVGAVVIEEMQRSNLINESRRKGEFLASCLSDCGVRHHAGKGLLAGLEFADEEQANAVVEAARRRGLLTVATGRKWVKLGPPLTITEQQIEDGCEILKLAIQEVIYGQNFA